MHIVINDNLGKAQKIPVNSVVVYDDAGTPIAASIKLMDRAIMTSHYQDSDFHEVLRSLGVDKTIFVENINVNP